MKKNEVRVPTQIHTRALDRMVARNNMKKAGFKKFCKHSYSGRSFLRTRLSSIFADKWRDFIN